MSQSSGFLVKRGKALEDEFFHRENQRLLETLRQMKQMEESKEALAEASGIVTDAILESLLELKIQAQTLAALVIIPLIEVAWADGHLDQRERQAILAAAHAAGLHRGHAGYELLESWLARQPHSRLLETWEQYIQELCNQLSGEERESLELQFLGRARSVAEASGGFLGLGFKVSKEEAAVLETLKKAFR